MPPWKPQWMQGPDPGFGPWSPGYHQQMVPHQDQGAGPQNGEDDVPDEEVEGESEGDESDDGGSNDESSSSSGKPKSSKHKKL